MPRTTGRRGDVAEQALQTGALLCYQGGGCSPSFRRVPTTGTGRLRRPVFCFPLEPQGPRCGP